jgi:hypothetical protein
MTSLFLKEITGQCPDTGNTRDGPGKSTALPVIYLFSTKCIK